jgi:hypothetical protein
MPTDEPRDPRTIILWDLFWREDPRVLLKPLQKKEVGLLIFSGAGLSWFSIFDRQSILRPARFLYLTSTKCTPSLAVTDLRLLSLSSVLTVTEHVVVQQISITLKLLSPADTSVDPYITYSHTCIPDSSVTEQALPQLCTPSPSVLYTGCKE